MVHALHLRTFAAAFLGLMLCAAGAGAETAKTDSRIRDHLPAPAAISPGPDESMTKPDPRRVDALLDALAAAPDVDSATQLEQSVLQEWLASGSDTIDLLMNRAVLALDAKAYPLALELLDAIIEMKPGYAEALNKRATLYYLIDDYDRSMRDIQATLVLEPRHFGALSGLGLILQEVGQKKGALVAFRQALAVHPYLSNVQENIDELVRDVEGDAI